MITVPDNCKGCGKCCMWMQFKDSPVYSMCPNCGSPWLIYFGRCPHLTTENECDMYGGPLACRDDECPIQKGDQSCIKFLEDYEKYK